MVFALASWAKGVCFCSCQIQMNKDDIRTSALLRRHHGEEVPQVHALRQHPGEEHEEGVGEKVGGVQQAEIRLRLFL